MREAFTIEFDPAYLERLTAGAEWNSAAYALEQKADRYMFDIMYQAGTVPKQNGAELHPFTSPLFDPNATYTVQNTMGPYEKVPALSVLYARPVTQEEMYAYLLGRKWTTYPMDLKSTNGEEVQNPNGNGGRFAPPIWLSARNKGWNIFPLLANPELDPNPDVRNILYTGIDYMGTVGKEDERRVWMKTDGTATHTTTLDMLTFSLWMDFHNEDPKTGRYAELLRDHYVRAISGMIDAGAMLTAVSAQRCEDEPVLSEKISNMVERADDLLNGRAYDVSLQDLKHLYALGQLNDLMVRAAEDDDLAAPVLELRDQMPRWMLNHYQHALDLLGANTWQSAIDAGRADIRPRDGRG